MHSGGGAGSGILFAADAPYGSSDGHMAPADREGVIYGIRMVRLS